ncbi:MAG: hypothetical protein NZ893_01830 [Candidatus Aenigmarchaeota archaeon]|nr:hypothetical protein [Candidatus Aenigmarchaeota archaeon]
MMRKPQPGLYMPNDKIVCLRSNPHLPQLKVGEVYKVQLVQKSRGVYFIMSRTQRPFKISSSIVEDARFFKKIN